MSASAVARASELSADAAGSSITLPYRFTPRGYQAPFFQAMDSGFRRAIAVWHRRSGKDKTFINYQIREACRVPALYYYFFPTYKQAKKVIWKGMDLGGFKFLNHFPPTMISHIDKTEMSIELTNGSLWQLIGTDHYDSIRGTNPYGCVFSEYAYQKPLVYDIVRPILRQNGGWAVFNFTPLGENHAYDLYENNRDNPGWWVNLLTVDDTGGIVTPEMIEEERREGMAEEMIEQEYYCSFTAGLVGSYFGQQMRQAASEGRIGPEYGYDSSYPVDTWWDLGVGAEDATAIWFTQTVPGRNRIHLIHFFEDMGQPLSYYVRHMEDFRRQTGCRFGRLAWPHDGGHPDRVQARPLADVARDYGINPEVTPRTKNKLDSIDAARRILMICCFNDRDPGIQYGIKALKSYHKSYDEERKVYKNRPDHDWSSHAADAFMVMADNHELTYGDKVSSPTKRADWRSGKRAKRGLKIIAEESAERELKSLEDIIFPKKN